MMTLKLIALVLGGGALVSLAADFSPDFVLAIVACLS
jgi:hypothetical protein